MKTITVYDADDPADRAEVLRRTEGFYVGQLDEDELRCFERSVSNGEAIRSYEDFSGFFFGLAKVRTAEVKA